MVTVVDKVVRLHPRSTDIGTSVKLIAKRPPALNNNTTKPANSTQRAA
jgi:hypothetical protein